MSTSRFSNEKILRMNDLVQKFSKAGDLMRGFCACTLSTAKACTRPDQRRKFVQCDMDFQVLTSAEAILLLTLGTQLVSPEFYVSSSGEVRAMKESVQTRNSCIAG